MYEGKSILELHELLISKKVIPVELVKDVIELSKKDNNNAFEYIAEKEALEKVKNLDESLKYSLFYFLLSFALSFHYSLVIH